MVAGFSAGKRPGRHQYWWYELLLASTILLWSAGSAAAQWRLQPTLELAEIYTDNVLLAPSGKKEDEFVTQINPGIGLHGEGGRIKLSINYRLRNSIFANDADRNSSYHELSADGKAELIKNFLFVDAKSSISQQIVDAHGPVGLDNLNVGNHADVSTYGLSPYLKLKLANYAEGELRYGIDRVETRHAGIADAETQRYSLLMNSGPNFGRLRWDANYYQEDMNRSYGEDTRRKHAGADIRYHLLSAWNFLARGGYEDNRISTGNVIHNGSYWSAGLEWTPSRHITASATAGIHNWDADLQLLPTDRTSFHVGYRERDVGLIVGPSWNADVTHYTRRTTWKASYLEEITNTQTLQLMGEQLFVLKDKNGNIVIDPATGFPLILKANVFGLVNDEFLRKRAQMTMDLNTGRSGVLLGVFHEQREYTVSPQSEDVMGANASWRWQWASRTQMVLSGDWQRNSPSNTGQHGDLWHGSIAFIRNLARDVTASAEYSHLERNAKVFGQDYLENRVVLRLNMRF